MQMMTLSGMSDDDDEYMDGCLGKNIISFIHLKEMDQFTERYISKSFKNDRSKNYVEEIRPEHEHVEEESDEDCSYTFRTGYEPRNNWKNIWNRITEDIDALRSDFDLVCGHYTKILSLHLKYSVSLDIKCFNSLLHCNKPHIVKKIFDKNLIHTEDKIHIKCLFNSRSLFHNEEYLRDIYCSQQFKKLLGSYTILFYSLKISEYPANIFDCLTNLAELMNSDTLLLETGHVQPKYTKKDIFKDLIYSAILNGVFTKQSLSSFLSISQARRRLLSDESSLEMDSDDDSDGDDSGMDFDEAMDHLHQRRLNGDQNNNPRHINVRKTIGEQCNMNADEIFPLRLKDLARISIKNKMRDFSMKNVKKMVLPKILKDFITFSEQTKSVIKKATEL